MCVYVYEYLPDVYIGTMCLPGTHGGHMRVSYPLQQELQAVLDYRCGNLKPNLSPLQV